MTTIAVIAFTFCLIVGMRNATRTARSIRWIEEGNQLPIDTVSSKLKFVILLPLLREQAVVAKLARRMEALELGSVVDARFVFISTSREGSAKGSTSEAIEDTLRQRPNPRFIHLHCDTGYDYCKADQLNYALKQLGLEGNRDDSVFIGVYDADSSPDPGTISYVVRAIEQTSNLRAIQQVPFYFQNVRNPKNLRELFLMTRPLHNALFAFAIEVPCMRRQAELFSRPKSSLRRIASGWLSHGLGHGQFFRLDALTEHGGFQAPSCDTQFGHTLALCGIPIYPHPMLDVGQTPESIRVLMQQGIVWFNSMNTVWRTKRMADDMAAQNYSWAGAWAMTAKVMHSNLAWAAYPILFLSALCWTIASGKWLLSSYGLLAWAVYLVPVGMILARLDLWMRICSTFEPIQNLSLKTKAGILLMFGVEKLGSCVSPWLWCAYAVHSLLRGTRIALHKTDRAEV
jgi:cellulose synthase/poly-beta-1,6-N-acetylglucosamine synthase-like glycosyltransferase